MVRSANRKMVAARSEFGFGFLRRRDQDFQQEVGHVRRARSRSTKEVVQTAAGQPRRWKQTRWVGVSPPLPRVIARQADRTGFCWAGTMLNGAVGRSENGGGSKRFLFWVFEEKRSGFPTRGWAVRRARNRQTKEVLQTAVWPTSTLA